MKIFDGIISRRATGRAPCAPVQDEAHPHPSHLPRLVILTPWLIDFVDDVTDILQLQHDSSAALIPEVVTRTHTTSNNGSFDQSKTDTHTGAATYTRNADNAYAQGGQTIDSHETLHEKQSYWVSGSMVYVEQGTYHDDTPVTLPGLAVIAPATAPTGRVSDSTYTLFAADLSGWTAKPGDSTYHGDFYSSSSSRDTTFDGSSTAGLLVTDHGTWHVVNGVITHHVADYTANSGSTGDAHLVDTSVRHDAYLGVVTTVDTNTGHGERALAITGHLDTADTARPDTFHRLDTYTFDTTLVSVTGSYTVPHHQITTSSYAINNPSTTVNPLATQYQTTYVNLGPTVAHYSPHATYPFGGFNFTGGYGVGYMGFGAFYVNTGITNAYPGVALAHTYDVTTSNGSILHAPYALVSPYGSPSYTFTPVAKTINATPPAAAKPAPTASPTDTTPIPKVPDHTIPAPPASPPASEPSNPPLNWSTGQHGPTLAQTKTALLKLTPDAILQWRDVYEFEQQGLAIKQTAGGRDFEIVRIVATTPDGRAGAGYVLLEKMTGGFEASWKVSRILSVVAPDKASPDPLEDIVQRLLADQLELREIDRRTFNEKAYRELQQGVDRAIDQFTNAPNDAAGACPAAGGGRSSAAGVHRRGFCWRSACPGSTAAACVRTSHESDRGVAFSQKAPQRACPATPR
jgi:hypothetical protein